MQLLVERNLWWPHQPKKNFLFFFEKNSNTVNTVEIVISQINMNGNGAVSAAIKEKRQRSRNLSPHEKTVLLDQVTEHFSVIENRRTDAVTQQQKAKEWEIIAAEFNSICNQYHRMPDQLKSSWENMKKLTRKIHADNRIETLCTGGGPPKKTIKDDPLFVRIYELIRPTVEGMYNAFDTDSIAAHLDTSSAGNTVHADCGQESQIETCSKNEDIGTVVDVTYVESSEDALLNGNWTHYSPAMLRKTKCSLLRTPVSTPKRTLEEPMPQTVCPMGNDKAEDEPAAVPCRNENVSVNSVPVSGTSVPAPASSWRSRRRPPLHTQKIGDLSALHAAKIELIEMTKKHSVEESKMQKEWFDLKMLQEQEILKQEKLKTAILSLQVRKLQNDLQ
ncbi:uncharacterized protein LOC134531590 [Bacillus rossius redtenbacheri]|uniref:uncharacterized protein LOC134531590 n=1 Tax=Bacillus rossius redtenbacheri TaxID=93214 RepID=UPI002FDD98C9